MICPGHRTSQGWAGSGYAPAWRHQLPRELGNDE